MTRTATIIGGGIAGLTAASMLSRNGWRVDVYERAAGLPESGTALGMWPAAMQALDEIDVAAAVRETARRQDGAALLRPDGGTIGTVDNAGAGNGVYLLSRPALLRLLADAAADAGVHFGATVDPARLPQSDVVLAADGLHSDVRRAVFGIRSRARYVGVTTWRGTVDGDTGTVSETWGAGARFGITPHEGGKTNWFACVRAAPNGGAVGSEVQDVRAHFGHWHAGVRSVLQRLDPAAILRHDLYVVTPPLGSYVSGRVALLGDAAHAMTPDLGRGACEAIVDAVTIAGELIRAPSVSHALANYDRQRRRGTQRLARISRLVNRLAHLRRGTSARNVALKAVLAVGSSAR